MIALHYCRQSALQNLAEAQFNMGFAYESGLTVERNVNTAIEWYQLASGHLFEGEFHDHGFHFTVPIRGSKTGHFLLR